MRDLAPWGRAPARTEDGTPFLSLHRDMNRLFDEALRGFGLAGEPAGLGALAFPSVELSDHGAELRVTAELPGLEEKDIEVELVDGVLTLKGEKRTEIEDKERRYTERSYGRFERRLALGAEIDEDKVKAQFRNGVLTITLPKAADAVQKSRKIAITGG